MQEYAEQGDLFDVCSRFNKRQMPERIALEKVFYPLMQAMVFLHGNEILHRDIKPENIVIMADGNPKICDFGLGLNLSFEAPVSRVGTLARATSAMTSPPRQLNARHSSIHPRGPTCTCPAGLLPSITIFQHPFPYLWALQEYMAPELVKIRRNRPESELARTPQAAPAHPCATGSRQTVWAGSALAKCAFAPSLSPGVLSAAPGGAAAAQGSPLRTRGGCLGHGLPCVRIPLVCEASLALRAGPAPTI